jgi:multiple sugar transport system permease protein
MRGNAELPTRIKEGFLLFEKLMRVSRYRPVTPVGQLLWDEHARAYEKAVRHAYSPAEALARGKRQVQAELDRIYAAEAYEKVDWTYPLFGSLALALCGLGFVFWRGGADLRRRMRRSETLAGFAFVSPWVIGLLLLTAGPILTSIVYSFCRYDVLHPAEFVGMDNYIRLFSDDPLFWKSLANTAFMMLGVPLGMAVGLGIAMLLNTEVRGMRVYRTVFYLPAIVPMVASAILWIWVLNPEMGLVNSLLRMAGIADPPNWLQSASWLLGSKSAIILMGLWSAGSGMIIWLAGLKGIPQHLYEAAEIDGAGPWLRFCHVTLPMLSPYIFFNLIMGIIGTMQVFTQAYIMTKGGPDDSTMFYAYYLFNNAFRYFKMGYASALAWILFLVILALTLIQLKLSPRWVHYENEG